jgi:hypothetical protein
LETHARFLNRMMRNFFFSGRVKPTWAALAAYMDTTTPKVANAEALASEWTNVSQGAIDERAWKVVKEAFKAFEWECTSCFLFPDEHGQGTMSATGVAAAGGGGGGGGGGAAAVPTTIADVIKAAER